jgi:uncharacterized protein
MPGHEQLHAPDLPTVGLLDHLRGTALRKSASLAARPTVSTTVPRRQEVCILPLPHQNRTTSTGGTLQIQHDSEAGKFWTPFESEKAFLAYAEPDEHTLELLHTVVPPQEQGQGVGSALVEHVLVYAREQNKRIIPSCRFVRDWLGEHPEYQELVLK